MTDPEDQGRDRFEQLETARELELEQQRIEHQAELERRRILHEAELERRRILHEAELYACDTELQKLRQIVRNAVRVLTTEDLGP